MKLINLVYNSKVYDNFAEFVIMLDNLDVENDYYYEDPIHSKFSLVAFKDSKKVEMWM